MVKIIGTSTQVLGRATDPTVPIDQVVNDTLLKEMIVSGWALKTIGDQDSLNGFRPRELRQPIGLPNEEEMETPDPVSRVR
jgi:hypothetical protein